MERKRFLRTFAVAAAAGPMLIEACKKDSASGTTDSTSTSTTSTNGSTCTVTPTETEGPYPYVGGEITNPLNRANVTDGQTGVPLSVNFLVVNTNNNCNVVTGARVDIWHCNKDGYYSGYGNQPGLLGTKSYLGETWLRGYLVTDSAGLAKFTTIYPGWYGGRATHIHMEVFVNNVLKKVSQLTFSEAISDVVHVSSLYASHGVNPTRNASDSVFGDSTTDLANETLALTGSVSEGYSGTFTLGIAL
ncbi:intradiol ring-cleavage dioxygenase [Mucilaginibacter sabulilitoris]|uniref:Intradiol ring-cleavage dioxygenase n=1 Tax=Mucilaginibacter sabulilitoris TaxID=1173583 RepID=A0ABZ0TR55_9SPHI|nr:intradiol ring-cleavage dioxygenase [Mucilaginibacter sabulilitoris]WPU94578.1 intradiol ring-cleavage dioxygenase [Mucilaginibacter sabulilitoris]